ncbi:MAG: hypothetical protein QHH24_07490 [Candidatus Bathyarchaeota archaeon]|nr:hypothetical protein [Candidatus Bathyarchaeota archaeon]
MTSEETKPVDDATFAPLLTLNDRKQNYRKIHLFSGLICAAVISMIILISTDFNYNIALALIVFNFIFVSLIFPLDGSLKKKAALLAIGNIIGFFWNYLFLIASSLEIMPHMLQVLLSPFLNLLWVVSYWSLSLSFMTHSGAHREG